MSRIDDLIAEYCPDGVEYKALCVVLVSLPKGTLTRGQLLSDGLYPVMNSGRDFYGWYDSKNNSGNAITIAARGEYAGYVNYIERDFWAGGLCYPYRSANEDYALTKYVYYVLKNDEQHIMDSLVARGSIPALNKKDLEKLRIPVPPLRVQEEIVRILDSFSSLEAELEAELEARRKQYAYYRDELLKFERERVSWLKLGDASFINKGTYITKKQVVPGDVPVILGGTEPAYWHSESNHDGEAIVVSRSGANAGFVSYWNEPIFVSDGFVLDAKQGIDMRFLFHALKTRQNELHSMKRGSGVPHINSKMLANVSIPIPPLEEQQRIVSILDRFDKLANDLSSGLPAEIEARHKQYEYYRDRLLSFDELAA